MYNSLSYFLQMNV